MAAMGLVPMPKDALGFEATGIVKQVGSAIGHVQAGDRVFAISTGLFATRKVLPGRAVFKMPETLTFEEAATMPIVYATVIYALITLGQLRKGQVCWPKTGDMKLNCTEPRLTFARSVNPHPLWDWWCRTGSYYYQPDAGRRGERPGICHGETYTQPREYQHEPLTNDISRTQDFRHSRECRKDQLPSRAPRHPAREDIRLPQHFIPRRRLECHRRPRCRRCPQLPLW